MSRPFDVLSPGDPREPGEEWTMLSHESIATFCGGREYGRMLIPVHRTLSLWVVRQCMEDRFSPAVNGAIRLDEMNRGFEAFARNFGKLFSDARGLKREVFVGVACGLLPSFEP